MACLRVWILMILLCIYQVHGLRQPTVDNHRKLLLISLDGFSVNYVKKAEKLEVFNYLKNKGVKARYMIPPFPTLTNPAHTTLATGLYVESHGVVHNNYFDYKTQNTSTETYLTTGAINEWWDSGYEPVWITAANNGQKSGCYMFPGCNATIGGKTATRSVLQIIGETSSSNGFWEEKIQAAVSWLADDDFDFVAIYFCTIDSDGHYEHPTSSKMSQSFEQINSLLMDLFDRLKKYNLLNNLNIIITSDHGMYPVNRSVPQDEVIVIEQYITDKSMVKFMMFDRQVVGFIEPADGYKEIVYQLLKADKHMDVYYKEDIPNRWHFKTHERIPSILMVAHPGYELHETFSGYKMYGNHGYDNQLHEMKTIFYAVGPDF